MEKHLSVFIDESGDYGFINDASKYYIFSFVIHEQKDNLNQYYNIIKDMDIFHAGPLIRKEDEYLFVQREERKKIFHKFFLFAIGLPLRFKSFIYYKEYYKEEKIFKFLERDVLEFLNKYHDYFKDFDIVIYYDKGQILLSQVLKNAFDSSCLKYEFKQGVKAYNYRLFQVADLVSTIKLIEIKLQNNELSKSELDFSARKYWKKVYINGINKKSL